jgi:hypothetical protein
VAPVNAILVVEFFKTMNKIYTLVRNIVADPVLMLSMLGSFKRFQQFIRDSVGVI